MKHITKYAGVSKETIAVAVAESGRDEARFIGTMPNTVEAIRKLIQQLSGEDVQLEFCYEAGPIQRNHFVGVSGQEERITV